MDRLQNGTPEQFMSALDAKIAELEGQVESGTRLTAKDADYVTYDTIEAADDTDTSRYIHTLIGDVENALQSVEGVEGAATQINEDSLTVSVTFNTDDNGARVVEYEVPFEDLKFDWNAISEDVEQILEHVQKDAYIEECDRITAAYEVDDVDAYEDEDEEYNPWKILKQKSVPDSDGFMTEYTLYEYLDVPDDVDGDIYICMFGDSDLYPPDINYADYSTSNKKDALDWFNNFGEEEY